MRPVKTQITRTHMLILIYIGSKLIWIYFCAKPVFWFPASSCQSSIRNHEVLLMFRRSVLIVIFQFSFDFFLIHILLGSLQVSPCLFLLSIFLYSRTAECSDSPTTFIMESPNCSVPNTRVTGNLSSKRRNVRIEAHCPESC